MTPDKKEFLDNLQNDYGDFHVWSMTKVGDDIKSSKWETWMEAREMDRFVEKINNRTILDSEVVLDLEDPNKYEAIIKDIDNLNLGYKAYKTGSRGYHIHLIFDELRSMDDITRKKTKETIIRRYGCDLLKSGNKAGIALENVPHWKTGSPKVLIKEKKAVNKLSMLADDGRTINFQYLTDHIPHFRELRSLSALQGAQYDIILKGVDYSIFGVILRDKPIEIGQLKTDSRMSLTIPIPSGQGKKNLKMVKDNVLKKMGYSSHVITSFHSQQLIGKVVKRGKGKNIQYIRNEGYLSRDCLLIDESYKLFASKDEDVQESRRVIRIAKDPINQNLIEKKQVDDLFKDEERIAYYPKVTIIQFLQPKMMPSDVVEEGDLRRDLVLYIRSLASRDKSDDYKNRLTSKDSTIDSLAILTEFFHKRAKEVAGKKFEFEPAAIERFNLLHKCLIQQGYNHSEKGKNFTNMVDFTLQDYLAKMSCIVAAFYGKVIVTPAAVDLAFMDLCEFFGLQLNFVQDKIMGRLDYGEGWSGADATDQKCLEWLFSNGADSEVSSNISVKQFKQQIAYIKNVSYDEKTNGGMAVKHYDRFIRNNWIAVKQVGQYDSKVWLAFKPDIAQGGKGCRVVTDMIYNNGVEGCKGCNVKVEYNNIITDLRSKIDELEKGYNPNNPNNPDKIEEYGVDT